MMRAVLDRVRTVRKALDIFPWGIVHVSRIKSRKQGTPVNRCLEPSTIAALQEESRKVRVLRGQCVLCGHMILQGMDVTLVEHDARKQSGDLQLVMDPRIAVACTTPACLGNLEVTPMQKQAGGKLCVEDAPFGHMLAIKIDPTTCEPQMRERLLELLGLPPDAYAQPRGNIIPLMPRRLRARRVIHNELTFFVRSA